MGRSSVGEGHLHTQALRALRKILLRLQRDDLDAVRDTLASCDRVLKQLVADYDPAAATEVAPVTTDDSQTQTLVTRERVQAYLDLRFGAGAAQIIAYQPLPGGRSKSTVRVTTEGSAGLPSNLVIRMDRPGSAQETSVIGEFPVLQSLHDAGVRAPNALWLERATSHLGTPFIVMERAPGESPGDYWSAGRATAELCRDLAKLLAELHAQDGATLWPDAARDARGAVKQLIDSYRHRWDRKACKAESVALDHGYDWIKRHMRSLNGPSTPVHGDVHFGNVLATGEVISCLTDWEFAHVGHPAEDLAFCRAYVEALLPWGEFLGAYQSHGGRAISDAELNFFRVWIALRNLTLATRLRGQLREGHEVDATSLVIAIDAHPRLETHLRRVLNDQSLG
jgi:aminoglycoside phosphotransferase (APT) family kinase protein